VHRPGLRRARPARVPAEQRMPKNVGLLLFNEPPHEFFPVTQIDVVYFSEGPGGGGFDEAIVNAACHHSYEIREPVEVCITPEKALRQGKAMSANGSPVPIFLRYILRYRRGTNLRPRSAAGARRDMPSGTRSRTPYDSHSPSPAAKEQESPLLTPEQLAALAGDVENYHVERKRLMSDKSKIEEAICAFANDLPGSGRAGVLLVGVEDDGQPSKLDITERLRAGTRRRETRNAS